ncbi:MAG: hypothetical protein JOZ41_07700 [Chloroflexi bacterium]|nr:hypothetical protein [Chloroflexota bacterium]
MPRERECEREWREEERAKRLQMQQEAKEIEAGNFICPLCQRYVDPALWWTHAEASLYENAGSHGPTVFHRRCGARPRDKYEWLVTAIRYLYDQSTIKPGDYVRPTKRLSRTAGLEQAFRVEGIEMSLYPGVTEDDLRRLLNDDPYYLLDSGDADPVNVGYAVQGKDLEIVGRPYLNS